MVTHLRLDPEVSGSIPGWDTIFCPAFFYFYRRVIATRVCSKKFPCARPFFQISFPLARLLIFPKSIHIHLPHSRVPLFAPHRRRISVPPPSSSPSAPHILGFHHCHIHLPFASLVRRHSSRLLVATGGRWWSSIHLQALPMVTSSPTSSRPLPAGTYWG
jgi:hypothetical protein